MINLWRKFNFLV